MEMTAAGFQGASDAATAARRETHGNLLAPGTVIPLTPLRSIDVDHGALLSTMIRVMFGGEVDHVCFYSSRAMSEVNRTEALLEAVSVVKVTSRAVSMISAYRRW